MSNHQLVRTDKNDGTEEIIPEEEWVDTFKRIAGHRQDSTADVMSHLADKEIVETSFASYEMRRKGS